MLKKMNITSKVIFFVITQLILFSLILTTISVVRMTHLTRNISNEIFLEKLDGDLQSAQKYIRTYYGELRWSDFTLVDSTGRSIEGDNTLVDAISIDKNICATIFVKQGVEFKRISTTVRNNRNERIIGTILEPTDNNQSAKASLLRGERFIGQLQIYDIDYLTGYMPLLDENNEVYGAIFLGIQLDTVNEKISAETNKTLIYTISVSLILILLSIFIVHKSINHLLSPIKDTIKLLKGIAEAETSLEKRLDIKRQDEMGELALYFNKILDEIFSTVVLIIKNANNVYKKSKELSTTAQHLIKNSINMSDQSLQISASSEEVNLNINKIIGFADDSSISVASIAKSSENLTSIINYLAVTTEQTNADVNTIMEFVKRFESTLEETGEDILTLVNDIHQITGAIEKINRTFSTVVKNSQLAHDKSSIVCKETHTISMEMNVMSEQTKAFGKIAKSMTTLNEQANMLIFNLSLEATRMGEPGKGFLTVSNELKEVRKEFADYLDDLIVSIEKIQSISNSLKLFINLITENLCEMNTAIISSINEQNFTIEEITISQRALSLDASNTDKKIISLVEYARNIITYVNQAVKVFGDITKNSLDSATASSEITNQSNIANNSVLEISKISQENTNILNDLAKHLSQIIFDINATTMHAETTKKVSEELNQIADELKKQSEMFRIKG